MARSPRGPGVFPRPRSPSLHSSLILCFHTFKPRGHRTPRGGGTPAPLRVSTFHRVASPKPAPGHARAVLDRRAPPPPLSSLPRQPGQSRERARAPAPPVHLFSMTPAAGSARGPRQQKPPMPRGGGARRASLAQAPGRPQTTRETAGKGRPSYCSYLRPPGPWPHTRATAFGSSVSLCHPRQCGPCKFTMLAVRRIHRAPWESGIPRRRGAFTRGESCAGGGGEDREVSGERNNWPRAVKTK